MQTQINHILKDCASCTGLDHRGLVEWKLDDWYSEISLPPAEVGLVVDRPVMLEHLYILASHCGGFTARPHLISITWLSSHILTSSWLWNEPGQRGRLLLSPFCFVLFPVGGSRCWVESWLWGLSSELRGEERQVRAAAEAKCNIPHGRSSHKLL